MKHKSQKKDQIDYIWDCFVPVPQNKHVHMNSIKSFQYSFDFYLELICCRLPALSNCSFPIISNSHWLSQNQRKSSLLFSNFLFGEENLLYHCICRKMKDFWRLSSKEFFGNVNAQKFLGNMI